MPNKALTGTDEKAEKRGFRKAGLYSPEGAKPALTAP
jgi:hypothetical protein